MEEPPIVVVNPEQEPVETLRDVLQYAYPAVLLFAFVVVGATDSIIAATRRDDVVVPTVTGPGGKPLPVTKRKRESQDEDEQEERYSPTTKTFFRCCMMLATFTFFCAGAVIAARALCNRTASGGHGWWCGEPKTVSHTHPFHTSIQSNPGLSSYRRSEKLYQEKKKNTIR
jgi:ATP-binding cassette, subfamily B, vacuolar membrane transporter HMT1/ACLQ